MDNVVPFRTPRKWRGHLCGEILESAYIRFLTADAALSMLDHIGVSVTDLARMQLQAVDFANNPVQSQFCMACAAEVGADERPMTSEHMLRAAAWRGLHRINYSTLVNILYARMNIDFGAVKIALPVISQRGMVSYVEPEYWGEGQVRLVSRSVLDTNVHPEQVYMFAKV